MRRHDVVVCGAGPTGLMLAAELHLAGVDVALVERRPTAELVGARAGGLHARTIEVLDQRGIAERFLAEGKPAQVATYASVLLDISDFPTRHNYGLALSQNHFERILSAWVDELGVPIHRACDVTGFTEGEGALDILVSNGEPLRAQYLVGCDGGRSAIRKIANIDFPGFPASVSYLLAEAETHDPPAFGLRRDDKGVHAIAKLDERRVRIVSIEPEVREGDAPSIDELKAALRAVYGSDFGVHSVTWLSRFTDTTRQAATYRAGRVLLAGDAAHIHSPAGGQGLNLGLQDAVNLGWKLAQVVKGISGEGLLDTYFDERHPVAARALKTTLATTAANRGDERTNALREGLAEVFKLDESRKRFAGWMSGLDLRYDVPAALKEPTGALHPLVGRRVPDLDLTLKTGPARVFSLLHAGHAVLLQLQPDLGFDSAALARRWPHVDHVIARYDGPWDLPVTGRVDAPSAVLIRPDGYVAWCCRTGPGDAHAAAGTPLAPSVRGLETAMEFWFGPPN